MSSRRNDLESATLDLPIQERARLAHRLLESLDEEAAERPREVEEVWNAEIERRLAAYREGEIGAVPASEVFEEARNLVNGR